ncbi:nuclease CAN2 [Carex littledalei]|uniref:Nuclease CAN2 n=1 Tax=Carex littledalei TaxID=544730 RepID=A0A833VL33_9POAL|nr:nuclease CAN2 [Carex littledalei]
MGNAILRCFRGDCDDTPPPATPHRPASPAAAGLANLELHLLNFESTSQVPEGLSQHVTLSKKAQAKWYAKILAAWRESSPRTPEEAASLVARALQVQRDALAGFLRFYSLPFPQIQTQVSGPSSWPEGVQFELHTLPVEAKLVGDGDGMTVHVNTEDPRESGTVPIEVQEAAIERRQARAIRDYVRADALHKIIMDCGYRVITANNEEILAREYRIRLRGIDAPEMNMEYGQEAKDALTKLIQGKTLRIQVYEKDRYDRLVGDVYCNGIFVQEKLLRKGCAWHYDHFDKRPSFAQWQKEARNAGRGLWANPNPVEPWEFKKMERNTKNGRRPYHNRRNAQRDQRVPIQAY